MPQPPSAAHLGFVLLLLLLLIPSPLLAETGGVPKADRAVLALEKLAESGSSRARFELARRYETGVGVARDAGRAFDLYCDAASAGSAAAANAVARLYQAGDGVAKDGGKASLWYGRARKTGAWLAGGARPAATDSKLAPPNCRRHGAGPAANRSLRAGAPALRPGQDGPGQGGTVAAPRQIRALVERMAPDYGLDPGLLLAVMQAESSYQADAVSPKGAQGLMQLIPDTAARFGVRNAFDPEDNIRGGMKYLRWLLAYFEGSVDLVLAAYNAGEGSVTRHGGIPPFAETRDYVARIMALYPRSQHPFNARIVKARGLGKAEQVAVSD